MDKALVYARRKFVRPGGMSPDAFAESLGHPTRCAWLAAFPEDEAEMMLVGWPIALAHALYRPYVEVYESMEDFQTCPVQVYAREPRERIKLKSANLVESMFLDDPNATIGSFVVLWHDWVADDMDARARSVYARVFPEEADPNMTINPKLFVLAGAAATAAAAPANAFYVPGWFASPQAVPAPAPAPAPAPSPLESVSQTPIASFVANQLFIATSPESNQKILSHGPEIGSDYQVELAGIFPKVRQTSWLAAASATSWPAALAHAAQTYAYLDTVSQAPVTLEFSLATGNMPNTTDLEQFNWFASEIRKITPNFRFSNEKYGVETVTLGPNLTVALTKVRDRSETLESAIRLLKRNDFYLEWPTAVLMDSLEARVWSENHPDAPAELRERIKKAAAETEEYLARINCLVPLNVQSAIDAMKLVQYWDSYWASPSFTLGAVVNALTNSWGQLAVLAWGKTSSNDAQVELARSIYEDARARRAASASKSIVSYTIVTGNLFAKGSLYVAWATATKFLSDKFLTDALGWSGAIVGVLGGTTATTIAFFAARIAQKIVEKHLTRPRLEPPQPRIVQRITENLNVRRNPYGELEQSAATSSSKDVVVPPVDPRQQKFDAYSSSLVSVPVGEATMLKQLPLRSLSRLVWWKYTEGLYVLGAAGSAVMQTGIYLHAGSLVSATVAVANALVVLPAYQELRMTYAATTGFQSNTLLEYSAKYEATRAGYAAWIAAFCGSFLVKDQEPEITSTALLGAAWLTAFLYSGVVRAWRRIPASWRARLDKEDQARKQPQVLKLGQPSLDIKAALNKLFAMLNNPDFMHPDFSLDRMDKLIYEQFQLLYDTVLAYKQLTNPATKITEYTKRALEENYKRYLAYVSTPREPRFGNEAVRAAIGEPALAKLKNNHSQVYTGLPENMLFMWATLLACYNDPKRWIFGGSTPEARVITMSEKAFVAYDEAVSVNLEDNRRMMQDVEAKLKALWAAAGTDYEKQARALFDAVVFHDTKYAEYYDKYFERMLDPASKARVFESVAVEDRERSNAFLLDQ